MKQPIIFFDSGIGGLTILRAARLKLPGYRFVYVADDAYFPYGDKSEIELKNHILELFANLIQMHNPCLCVIACNTASTLVLDELRSRFSSCLFVGTVPAIKFAAQHTYSGLISVLATPATVKRDYTKKLISKYAEHCSVTLVGSANLAAVSENYIRMNNIDSALLEKEIAPCFVAEGEKRTDIIVLACTHYPFLINQMRVHAPWPVDWLDPSEFIANRIKFLLESNQIIPAQEALSPDLAYFTSNTLNLLTERILRSFGLTLMLDNKQS